ncbi:hypothetical protein [Escherichia coli]|uniref:hypothetical protein n=1 Tax=Escherichia coli TaxID=562 RepID=UPI00234F7D7D|nr:hypothetical protein [Escherichia coli]WCQ45936.1 hypothetical protein NL420_007725 [Escherichia coli]
MKELWMITTSDESMKEPCGCSDDLLLKEKQAANEIRKCIYRYKLKESIRSKGGNARYLFGVGRTAGVLCANGLTGKVWVLARRN